MDFCPLREAAPPSHHMAPGKVCALTTSLQNPLRESPAPESGIVRAAKRAYAIEELKGSDDKDVFSSRVFTAIGAQVDSSPEAVASGLTTVALPAEKKLALSIVSLRAPISEDLAASLSGSWVSCLLYRRCMMSVLSSFFGLVKNEPSLL